MVKSKPPDTQSASRSALRNVSNRQPNTAGGWSAPADSHGTPVPGGSPSQRTKPVSVNRFGQSVRRQFSKSHGDLSKLRPKSPPLAGLPGWTAGLHLSPGNFVDDTQNAFSPDYNRWNRHTRQAIPNDWLPRQSALNLNNSGPDRLPHFELPPPPLTLLTRSQNLSHRGTTSPNVEPSPPPSISPTLDQDWSHRSTRVPNYELPPPSCSLSAGGQGLEQAPIRLPPISIQGLGPDILSPLDFCIPIVRTYPASANQRHGTGQRFTDRCPVIQHVNVKTVWNGLRYVEAQELYRIHQAFTMTLRRMLTDELWKISEQRDGIPATKPSESLHGTCVVRGISFCRDQLVEEMADWLYSSNEDMARAQLGLIRLYLAASDCLVPYEKEPRDISITVRVCRHHKSPALYPVVTAAWVPDRITSKQSSEALWEGQEFTLIPEYQSRSAFGSTRPPKSVTWTIESQNASVSWLVWCDDLAGFKGVVPLFSNTWNYSRHSGNTLGGHQSRQKLHSSTDKICLDIKAVLIDDNGSLVRFERVVHARLTLGVLPWYTSNKPLLAGHNQSAEVDTSRCQSTPGFTAPTLPRATGSLHTQPYNANVDVHVVKEIDQGHFNPGSLTARPTAKTTRLPELAKKNAELATKYTDMAQRHTDAATHVKMLDSLTTFGSGGGHEAYSPTYYPAQRQNSLLAHRFHRERQSIGDYTDASLGFDNAASHETLHRSQLEARLQAPGLYRTDNATFPTSPSPAMHSFPSQTFDEDIQAWNRIRTPERTLGPQSQPLWFSNTVAPEFSHNIPRSGEREMLRNQAEALYGSPVRQNYRRDLETAGQASETPPTTEISEVAPKSKQNTRKRHANSRLKSTSSMKRAKEDDNYSDDVTLVLDGTPANTTWAAQGNLVFDTQSGRHGKKPTSLGQEEGESSNQSRIHREDCTDFAHAFGIHQTQPSQDTLLTSYGRPNERLPASVPAAVEEISKPSPSMQRNIPDLRAVSVQSYQTRNTYSRAPSSSVACLVEDPQVVLSRSEQAQVWAQLPGTEDSDKENQPEPSKKEPKLSDEEKRAHNDAVDRSLLDLTGGFDSIFLDDSDSSSADDRSASN